MKAFDELSGLAPEAATMGNPHYERYRIALKWIGVGITAAAIGVVGDLLGIRESLAVGAVGIPEVLIGSAVMAREVSFLPKKEPDQ